MSGFEKVANTAARTTAIAGANAARPQATRGTTTPSSFTPQTAAALEQARTLEMPDVAVRGNLAEIIARDPAGARLSPAVVARTVDKLMRLKTLRQTVSGAMRATDPAIDVSRTTLSRLETQITQELPEAAVRANLVDTMRADPAFANFNESRLTTLANQLLTLDSVPSILRRALEPAR